MKWIIVISLTAFLAVTLMPITIPNCNQGPPQQNQIKQIMTILIKNRTDTRQTWPNPWSTSKVPFPTVTNNHEAMLVTAAMLEYLAYLHDLSPDLFIDPADPPLKSVPTARAPQEIIAKPNPFWARHIALDWSAPKSNGTLLPCVSSRQAIDGKFIVSYQDTHIAFIPATEPVNTLNMSRLQTWQSDESTTYWSALTNSGDDIFSYSTDTKNPAFSYAAGYPDIWMK